MGQQNETTARAERRWPMALAVLAAVGLTVGTPHAGRLPGWWIVPILELVLLVILIVADPGRIDDVRTRPITLALITVMTVGTLASLSLLMYDIFNDIHLSPDNLLGRGGAIWVTNVIAFSLWFWELDRGGPAQRAAGAVHSMRTSCFAHVSRSR